MKLRVLLLLLFACCTYSAMAQGPSSPQSEPKEVDSFIRENSEKRAKNPDGLLFTVRLKVDKKQFQMGEVIPLELSFASSKPETLTMDAATYDRSGRLDSDGFVLDRRDGAVDPLADYFQSAGFMMMGGLRSIPVLTDKPNLIAADLNEWQRIEKPGHYRLYVVSSRVSKKGGSRVFFGNGDQAVASNVIEFDVLPFDEKWSKQKLDEAVRELTAPGLYAGHRQACRTLRFLGTTAAASEMRKGFRGDNNDCEYDYQFGLLGSPKRDFVIRDMENAITLSDQPISRYFLSTLASLEYLNSTGAGAPFSGDEAYADWNTRRETIISESVVRHLRQLMLAIPQKEKRARAISLQTLVDSWPELGKVDSTQKNSLAALLPEVFTKLPLDGQLHLLKDRWKTIASATMLPVLREVFNYTYKASSSNAPEVSQKVFHELNQQDLRSIALRRIHELSPEEGRRLIIEEMQTLRPRVNQEVLFSLADETLPELTPVLLKNFQETRRNGNWSTETHSQLIERYATDEILDPVRSIYESQDAGKWSCSIQAPFLAYFLRVAPALGREYIDKALASRDKGYTRCFTETLKNVAALHMSPELEEIAISALDDDDSKVVSEAASVLAEYGSADAEKALWRRFEKLHQEFLSQSEKQSSSQKEIEKVLREALVKGHAWLSDPEQLKRIRELCTTETDRAEVDQLIGNWDCHIYVDTLFSEDELRINVGNTDLKTVDSLKQKLLQFPKGTVFIMRGARGIDSMAQEIFRKIEEYVEEHGMKVKWDPAWR